MHLLIGEGSIVKTTVKEVNRTKLWKQYEEKTEKIIKNVL